MAGFQVIFSGRFWVITEALLGKWRLVEGDAWDVEYLNLVEPAHIQIGAGQLGRLVFGGLTAELDYRLSDRMDRPTIDFSWEGWDEDTQVFGRGWGVLDEDGRLRLRLYIHNGDESGLVAERIDDKKELRRRRR